MDLAYPGLSPTTGYRQASLGRWVQTTVSEWDFCLFFLAISAANQPTGNSCILEDQNIMGAAGLSMGMFFVRGILIDQERVSDRPVELPRMDSTTCMHAPLQNEFWTDPKKCHAKTLDKLLACNINHGNGCLSYRTVHPFQSPLPPLLPFTVPFPSISSFVYFSLLSFTSHHVFPNEIPCNSFISLLAL
jgi:hypothetical protein